MREQGRVVTVGEGTVDVTMEISPACGGCRMCATSGGGETVMRNVRDPLGASVGDTVEVSIPDAVRGRAAAAVFLVPVACLLLGYLAGFLLGPRLHVEAETAGVIGAVCAATIAVIGVRGAERLIARSARFAPRVSAIIARAQDRSAESGPAD